MGCCPSKCPVASPRKEYAAETTEASLLELSRVNSNQAEARVDDGVQEMLMDRGDGTSMDKSDEEEPAAEAEHGDSAPESLKLQPQQCASKDYSAVLLRRPEPALPTQSPPSPPPSPPRKSFRSADEIPISSTYHRVHSAVVEEQEVKRKEELRLVVEQRAREVREYKAALQLA